MSDYKRNPRGARRARKSLNRKALVVLSMMMVLVLAAVGGTVAWLMDKTDPVVNTFTVGNVDIDLDETTTNFKMVPGNTIAKDPYVTVTGGSEACWLFVKVEESSNLDYFISYTVDSSWTQLTGVDGVFYREVAASTADQTFKVLTNDQVTVNGDVTKERMDAITATTEAAPTLTFTAYACQKDNVGSAADAWAKLNPTPAP